MNIRIERPSAHIVQISIDNQSRRNALTYTMLQSLAALWPELERDSSVRAIVLTGAGEEAFCSGVDLTAGLAERDGFDELLNRAILKTSFFAKPIIAAVAGHCVAAGLELALSADIRIASYDAKMGVPEVKWGIFPSGGATMKLIDQIGQAHAMDLLLTGRLIDGRRAEQIGLVSSVTSRDLVLQNALVCADLIAANSDVAVLATKRAALAQRYRLYEESEPGERQLTEGVRQSGHWRTGIDAFLARKAPAF